MLKFLALRIRGLRRGAESGIAMVMVIGVGSVLTLMVVAAVAASLGSMNKAHTDEEWNAALAAAYAGIEEYQSLLSDDPSYVKYGNPAAKFSLTSTAMALPAKANPAFGIGPTGTWAEVAGSDGEAHFRYEVDNSAYAATGTIKLRSTGKVGSETRSIVADLRQKGFIDFLYFTDYEMSDPSVLPGCVVNYAWDRPGTSCNIQFGSSDVIGGPVHSNDRLMVCGAHFQGTVTTGNPSGGYSTAGCSSTSGTKFDLGPPTFSDQVPMPATNRQLIKEMRTDLTEEVPRPGCLYTGPTRIELLPTQSGGKARMTVWSPWTKVTRIGNADQTIGTAPAACGLLSQLRSASGATIDVPQNNVVYVQNIPLTGLNASTESETTRTSSNQCRKVDGTRIDQNVVGFPADDERALKPGIGSSASYGCRNGDVFIKGTLNGATLTVGAQNYVYITGDIRYHNAESDMLGLVGDNAVWVYNPVNSSNGMLLPKQRTIHAAVLSVQHTFMVQNYNVGSHRGDLTVVGAIAQKFRGVVGTTGGTGYNKVYIYDKRFRFAAPPKFLSPVTTTYGVNVWIEINPVYNADGTYR